MGMKTANFLIWDTNKKENGIFHRILKFLVNFLYNWKKAMTDVNTKYLIL